MSSLIVEVCEIQEVKPHPNADRLAIAKIKGWETCIGINQFKVGDKVVYLPPDCVLPTTLSDRLNVTKYLSKGRVKVANLRSIKSYGLIMICEEPWGVGTDVAEHYGITKYEPVLRCRDGDAARPHNAFHKYFDMENIRHFPNLFTEGEEVVLTEKLHGQNCRLGLIKDTNEDGEAVWRWMAGSHEVRRKYNPEKPSVFWQCFTPEIRNLLASVSNSGYTPTELDQEPLVKDDGHNVILFAERLGDGVQDLKYGYKDGKFVAKAFDLTIDGKYVDFDEKMVLFAKHNVATVPVIYRGGFDFEKVTELAEGETLLCSGQIREGVVVLPIKERQVIIENIDHEGGVHQKTFERLQLKCISFAYLNRKGG